MFDINELKDNLKKAGYWDEEPLKANGELYCTEDNPSYGNIEFTGKGTNLYNCKDKSFEALNEGRLYFYKQPKRDELTKEQAQRGKTFEGCKHMQGGIIVPNVRRTENQTEMIFYRQKLDKEVKELFPNKSFYEYYTKGYDDMIVIQTLCYDKTHEDINKLYLNNTIDEQRTAVYNELCKKDDENIKSGKISDIKLLFRYYMDKYSHCKLDDGYKEKDFIIILN